MSKSVVRSLPPMAVPTPTPLEEAFLQLDVDVVVPLLAAAAARELVSAKTFRAEGSNSAVPNLATSLPEAEEVKDKLSR